MEAQETNRKLEMQLQGMMAHSEYFNAMLQEAIQKETTAESEAEKIRCRQFQERQTFNRDSSLRAAQRLRNVLYSEENRSQQGKQLSLP